MESHLMVILRNIPPEIVVMFIAMLPVSELRGALPIALGVYQMDVWQALFLSIFGNMIPVFFLLWFLNPLSRIFMKHSHFFEKFFQWIFQRTRRKFTGNYEKYGLWALFLFVAIPLPATGAWTGSLAAFLFGIPQKKALPLIFFGVVTAGGIVALISLGFFRSFFTNIFF